MEATCSSQQSSPRGFLLFAAFAIVAAGLYFAVATAPARPVAVPAPPPEIIVDDYSHSARDHPQDQDAVRRCLSDKNTLKVDFDHVPPGLDGYPRYLRVCVQGNRVIFQLIDRIGNLLKERTAYIRSDYTGMEQVKNYVIRKGYYRISGGLR